MRDVCDDGNAYHEDLPEIHDAAFRVVPGRWAEVACLLGCLKDEMTLVVLLCVGIAKELFIKVPQVKSTSLIEPSREVIESWR
jgi:hypothetical protein